LLESAQIAQALSEALHQLDQSGVAE
jgi:hypothetical protein